jgi:hypothetical protein
MDVWLISKLFLEGTPIKEGKTIIALHQKLNNMTQQPNEQNNNNPSAPQIEKLLIDDPNHFQFHAAYLVYSETFDKVTEAEAKKELNQNIEDLKSNKIDYETFYVNTSHHRKLTMPRQERFSLTTQRKKDWRKKTQRQERIKRHKK